MQNQQKKKENSPKHPVKRNYPGFPFDCNQVCKEKIVSDKIFFKSLGNLCKIFASLIYFYPSLMKSPGMEKR